MDSLRYNYMGKTWRPCPTVADGNCFFNAVFGTRDNKDQTYCDKYANIRRMNWSTFLTYYSNGNQPDALTDLLKKCFIANERYQHKSIENPVNYIEYTHDITVSDHWVLVEEIPLLATLENTRVVLFIDDRDMPEVFNPNPELLGKFPFRNIDVTREVVVCIIDNHFSRLEPYDQSVINEVAFTQNQNSNTKESKDTLSLIREKHYKKRGDAGIQGSLYQINLLTMVLLNGIKKVNNWRLSSEDEDADKFDDLIFESFPTESAILLQAKHKKNKRKKVTYEDLVSANYKNEFGLPKYFVSYQEILKKKKFKVQNIVICTNLDLDKSVKKYLKQEIPDAENILHFQGTDNICYSFADCCLPQLKQNIQTYCSANGRNKEVNITDEAIDDFLRHLLFLPNYLNEEILDNVVQETVSGELFKNLDKGMVFKDVHKKVLNWFKEEKGRYLTEVEAKGFLCDIRSNMYCDNLKLYDISFEQNNLPFIFQNQQKKGEERENLQQKIESSRTDAKRILHIIPEKEYILNVIKIYQALQSGQQTKALFVNPDETIDVQRQIIDAFEVEHYTILVIVCHKTVEENTAKEMCDKVIKILSKNVYKRVILIAEVKNNLARLIKNSNVSYETIIDSITFTGLEASTQEKFKRKKTINFQAEVKNNLARLIKKSNVSYETIIDSITCTGLEASTQEKFKRKKTINFQGSIMSLEELFKPSTNDVLNLNIDSQILVKLARYDEIKIGMALQHLEKYYICRTFIRDGNHIPEENMCHPDEISKEKVAIISDSAGMGKSTVLTSLAIAIKTHNPHLWVIRVDLSNYTNIMRTSLKAGIIEVLESQVGFKLESEFEKKLFLNRERVVLMLDGMDEVSPNYTNFMSNLLKELLTQLNLAKIFITTRPHLCGELQKILNIRAFTMKPFSEENQTNFLTKYWTEKLDLRDDIKKKKCEDYAKALIQEISKWINDNHGDTFAGIPLQTRMLSEVFQEKNQFRDGQVGDWEGCKEFLSSGGEKPKLSKSINLMRLYQMFIEKKRDIFIIDKGNPSGSAAAYEALKEKFEECCVYHRSLALETIFDAEECKLFTCHTDLDYLSPFVENYVLRVGIIQSRGEKLHFIHRTFAEYFAAECMLIELKRDVINSQLYQFLMQKIFYDINCRVIRVFLDNLITEEPPDMKNKIFKCFWTHDDKSHISRELLYQIAASGCPEILASFVEFSIGMGPRGPGGIMYSRARRPSRIRADDTIKSTNKPNENNN